ncbi:MAG: hypothetical protein ABMA64_04450 [Myxococcota bacterium]
MIPVLVVTAPGVGFDVYRPLLEGLRAAGARVEVVEPGCVGGFDSLTARVRAEIDRGAPTVVVADGLGATLALAAGGRVERYVLLGPVLAPPDTDAGRAAFADFTSPAARAAVLGEDGGGCVSTALAAELAAGWPFTPAPVDASVWVAMGMLDELAPVEVVTPASRALGPRRLVRLGVARFDPRDYTHVDLIRDPVAVEVAVEVAVGR